jgi:hypothetical protein
MTTNGLNSESGVPAQALPFGGTSPVVELPTKAGLAFVNPIPIPFDIKESPTPGEWAGAATKSVVGAPGETQGIAEED